MAVGVGCRITTALGLGDVVGVGLGVATAVGVATGVAVDVGIGAETDGFLTGVGVGEGVAAGALIAAADGLGVVVAVAVAIAVGAAVGVSAGVLTGFGEAVAVGAAVWVTVGVRTGVFAATGLGRGVGFGVAVFAGAGLGRGETVARASSCGAAGAAAAGRGRLARCGRGRLPAGDDHAAGGERGGGDDRGDLRGGGDRGAGDDARGSGPADPEHDVADGGERAGRRERGEAAAHAAQAVAVLAAGRAFVQVAPGQAARADAAVAGQGEVGADRVAGGVPGGRGVHEALARAHERGLHGGHREVQRDRHLGVAHPLQLAHQQGGALLLGEPAEVADERAQLLALLGQPRGVGVGRLPGGEHVARFGRELAQQVDAAVVGDEVQPRAQRHGALAGAQRAVGAHEHVLGDVLGILARAAEHLQRVGVQVRVVAVVDRPEGIVVARAEARDELFVRAQPHQRGCGAGG